MKYLRLYVLLCGLLMAYATKQLDSWNRVPGGHLNWDVYGYSFYLSSTFIYNDLAKAKFLDTIDLAYWTCGGQQGYGRFAVPNSENVVFKYTIGTAYFYAPFYLTTHAIVKNFLPQYKADGYSTPYNVGLTVGWICWSMWALYLLGCVLIRYFDVPVVLLALTVIAWGTNYYSYTVFIVGFGHIPSFWCNALGLYMADTWARSGQLRHIVGLALALSLAVLVRPPEMLLLVACVGVLVLLYQRGHAPMQYLAQRWQQIAIGAVVAVAVAFPQLWYWHYTTGHWLHYSYQGEVIKWTEPHLIDGFFSYRKGFLTYAPVMWLGVAGIPLLFHRNAALGWVWLVYMFLNCYVILSWQAWTYGGSLGARSMIQSLAFWSFPLACLLQWVYDKLHTWRSIAARAVLAGSVLGFVVGCIWLIVVQTEQYKKNILHWDNMSEESYWYIFGRKRLNEEERAYLEKLYNQPQ